MTDGDKMDVDRVIQLSDYQNDRQTKFNDTNKPTKCYIAKAIDVREGTSGTSADVPRFGLRMHSVSSAIGS